jgi:hypothetical protein
MLVVRWVNTKSCPSYVRVEGMVRRSMAALRRGQRKQRVGITD